MILKLLLNTQMIVSDAIRKKIEDYNSNKQCKILIVFDMITDILSNEKLSPIATELFI